MRMRKKPNLDVRLERCEAQMAAEPEKRKGMWRELYHAYSSLQLEIGCGKGRFTVETAKANPDVLLVAIEMEPNSLVMAMERAREAEVKNVVFIRGNASKLEEMFEPGEIDRIYINFCDPWPKSRDAKFRLTAPSFLRSYADLLTKNGRIFFKTDNTPLFDWSIEQMTAEGWALHELTHDLHANGPVGVMTDYEAKFVAEGMKINRVEAEKVSSTKTTAAGEVPRLRNAALSDARNN